MADLMRVPEVAAGATDVVLAQWLVAEGASFAAGAPLAVIETDKAQVEVEADRAAVLLRVLVPEGAEVPVGGPMALFGEEAEIGTDLDVTLASLGVESASEHPRPTRRDVPEDRVRKATEPRTYRSAQQRSLKHRPRPSPTKPRHVPQLRTASDASPARWHAASCVRPASTSQA